MKKHHFGRAARLASTLLCLAAAQAGATGSALDDRLASLLGDGRLAAAVVGMPPSGPLPPAAEREVRVFRGGGGGGGGGRGAPVLAAAASPVGDAEWRCLAEAVYFEARGEPLRGQVAVAEVVLNRVESPAFPDTVCAVVRQGEGSGGGCQFSYRCDGRTEAIADRAAWAVAGRVARAMLDGAPRELTDGATHYHASYVAPTWADAFVRTASIGAHRFYREPLRLAAN